VVGLARARGQALVELAIVLPILVLLLVIAIDFGRVFQTVVGVTNAAREGAVWAAVHPGDVAGAISRAKSELGLSPSDPSITVTVTCSPSPCTPSIGTSPAGEHTVTVSVSATYSFLTPLVTSQFGELPVRHAATSVIP
jgi:Flp pilus assembly protein TadG